MAKLILVKHSIPDIAREVPAKFWRLSSEGEARCRWLAREVSKFHPESLYSSVEAKAKETARLVGLQLGLNARTADGLHENDRTAFPYIDDKDEFEQRFREYFDHPDSTIIGNETASQARQRFHDAVAQIVERAPEQTACVIAHGTVISLFVSHFNDVPAFEIWAALNPLPAFIAVGLAGFRITDSAIGYPAEE